MNDQMEIKFEASAENEAFARMVISAFLVRRDPVLSVLSEVRTAVSEAVTNAVVHAYKESAGVVVMRAALHEDRIDIEIEDFGCGIENVEQAMQPFYTTEPDSERTGMGFSFMLSFMDKVNVESSLGTGTLVKMQKILGAQKLYEQ